MTISLLTPLLTPRGQGLEFELFPKAKDWFGEPRTVYAVVKDAREGSRYAAKQITGAFLFIGEGLSRGFAAVGLIPPADP